MAKFFVSVFALLFAFCLSAGTPTFAADKEKAPAAHCCGNCSECLETCKKTLEYCKKKGGKHADKAHIDTMKDCIALCGACTDLSARKSPLTAKLQNVCADACTKCAESCEKLNDKKMQDCVDMCKKCAEHCKSAK
jgi:hypothetical protein